MSREQAGAAQPAGQLAGNQERAEVEKHVAATDRDAFSGTDAGHVLREPDPGAYYEHVQRLGRFARRGIQGARALPQAAEELGHHV